MTTFILSSIIGLLVIAGLLWAAVRIGKWIHAQSRNKRFRKLHTLKQDIRIDGIQCRRGDWIAITVPWSSTDEEIDDEFAQERLIQDAKDILNKEA